MKPRALLLLLIFSVALALPAAAQDEALVSFTGFDYEDPKGGAYLAVGSGYKAVGFATSFHPTYLEPYVDTDVNEYTLYLHGLTVATYSFGGGLLIVTFADGGRVEYFEDASRNAQNPPNPPNCPKYTANPPNGDVPAKFADGALAVGGTLTDAQLFYDYNWDQGGFSAELTVDSGTHLVWIPVGSRTGWQMIGLARPRPTGDPCTPVSGYDHQVSGECRVFVTPSQQKTWGALKALYR